MNRLIIARSLRTLALLVTLGGLGVWFATGAHRGWSQTLVPTMVVDEVTGLEAPVYEERFVAGVDFLGAALLGAGALAGSSLFFRKPESQN